jgi:hypothetical protein
METRFVDGIGEFKAKVHPDLVQGTRDKYGRLSFHDPDHLNYILREHPELRVPTPRPRYLMVNGFRDSPSSARIGGAGNGARENPATAVLGSAHENTRAALPFSAQISTNPATAGLKQQEKPK